MAEDKDWMDELKEGGPGPLVGGEAKNMEAPPGWRFFGVFKFQIGEKVRSRIHEANGIIEHCEMTRYINGDQIDYKLRFNDPEIMKTETCMIDEQWLEKI